MKKTIATITLILALLSPTVNANSFFQEEDKQKHMALSALATNGMYALGMSQWQAFGTMLLIGAIKESQDDNTDREHGRDMIANAIGASTVFTWSIKF